jgi:mono/diheme cytochrome c family protein
MIRLTLVLALLAWRGINSPGEFIPRVQADAEGVEFFEKKIRPILVERCYECHSAEAKKLKGNLRLDSRAAMVKGGDLGPPIVSGDPEKSLLVKAIRWVDEDLKMPPKKRLSEEQVADFVAWVKRGAPYPEAAAVAAEKGGIDYIKGRQWWAFQPPKDAPVPPGAAHPIDAFILAKLREKGLQPALLADKRTLLRRATFDLIGLPPSPAEMDAFLADESPDAFAKVIDRLLASPAYGEKWGRHWLDVARYTDSGDARGMFGNEDIGEAWRYRDWVVGAFNRDLPYDQFVRLQIAGDLGEFSTEGILATGLFAIGGWGNGDSDKEKTLTDIVDDQIDVVGRAFLGVTLACARCHDHKFDPIATEDYYGLAGIFFSSHILPNPGPKTNGAPMLRIPLAPPAEVDARKKLEAEIAALEKKLEKETDAAWAAVGKDLLGRTAALLKAADEYRSIRSRPSLAEFAESKGLPAPALTAWLAYLGSGDLGLLARGSRDIHGRPGLHGWRNTTGPDTPCATVNTTDQEQAFGTIRMPPHTVSVHPSPTAGVGVGWRSPISGTVRVRGRVVDADNICGDGIEWTLDRVTGGTALLAKGAIPNGGQQDVPERSLEVKEGDLVQLNILPKKDYTCDTTVVEIQVAEADGQKRSWSLAHDVLEGSRAGSMANPMGVWCFYDMAKRGGAGALAPDSALAKWLAAKDKSAAADEVQRALLAPDAAKGPDAKLLKDLTDPKGPFLGAARKDESALAPETREALAKMREGLASLKQKLPPPIPVCHGLQEGGCPQTTWVGFHDAPVHIRGRYDRLGAVVPRRFPKVLAGDTQLAISKGSGRVELAAWLASPGNPMTAKVMVNRIWQGHFGEGIVRTPNNYGKLGQPPTHPELLDWLAREFVKSGWSIKAMHRLMMLSETYRRSSIADAAAAKADPGNLLFGRMNRRRLTAEELRDSLLAAGDTLDRTMGGLSVKEISSARRTLYLTTVRSDRSTYRMLFDAADPNAIVDRRIDSTVAPQALFLLNNPFALQQTQALARRAVKQGPADEAAKIQWLYPVLFGRLPTEREVRIGQSVIARGREAGRLAGQPPTPEQVWEPYCQILLCANEFIYID